MERAIVGHGGNNRENDVEGETEHNQKGGDINDYRIGKEAGNAEGETNEKKSKLYHKVQTFHDALEPPGKHAVNLELSIPTTVDERCMDIVLGIIAEPLLGQYGGKCNEEEMASPRSGPVHGESLLGSSGGCRPVELAIIQRTS